MVAGKFSTNDLPVSWERRVEMKSLNRIGAIITNHNDTILDGDMQYFIDYACKMLYPSEINIYHDSHSENGGKWIKVVSHNFIDKDKYEYFVDFNKKGRFVLGNSKFANKSHIDDIFDQNRFKQVIKKEINKLNCIHGAIAKLINR
jgi:hypothetical protein